MYLLDVPTRCCSRVGACPRPALPGACSFPGLPTVPLPGWLLFFPTQLFQLATYLTASSFPVCLFVCFLPGHFPWVRSLGWKIDVAGWVFSVIIWPGVLRQRLSQGGSFTIKEKTSHLLWRKAYIWCLFPPPSQAESSSTRGREAKPCWGERRCRAVLFGPGEPCPSVSLLPLSSLVFFLLHLGGKKKKTVLP